MQCPLHAGQQAIYVEYVPTLVGDRFACTLAESTVFQGSVIAFGRNRERCRQTDQVLNARSLCSLCKYFKRKNATIS